jgi:urease accessory protein
VLTDGAGRNDAILLCVAHGADDVGPVAELAAALAPSRERRMETLQQGAAFVATTRAVWGLDLPDMAYPVAVGRAAGLMGLPVVPVAQLWLQAFISNLVQAAQRLMPLGQTNGQKVLAGLNTLCGSIGEEAASASLDDLGAATFGVDIASMQHEWQSPRIFRS